MSKGLRRSRGPLSTAERAGSHFKLLGQHLEVTGLRQQARYDGKMAPECWQKATAGFMQNLSQIAVSLI